MRSTSELVPVIALLAVALLTPGCSNDEPSWDAGTDSGADTDGDPCSDVALLCTYETRLCICTCNENWRCTQA